MREIKFSNMVMLHSSPPASSGLPPCGLFCCVSISRAVGFGLVEKRICLLFFASSLVTIFTEEPNLMQSYLLPERGPDTLSVATIRIVHFSKMVILRCKLFLSSQTGRTKFFLLNFKGLQCFQTTIGLTRSLMFLMPKILKVNSNLGQSFGTSIHFQSFNFIHHF